MASTVTSITREKLNGDGVFIIRQYNAVADIGKTKPVDVWESFELLVDEDSFNYLLAAREDEAIWKAIEEKVEPLPGNGRNKQVNEIFRDTVNKT